MAQADLGIWVLATLATLALVILLGMEVLGLLEDLAMRWRRSRARRQEAKAAKVLQRALQPLAPMTLREPGDPKPRPSGPASHLK